MPKLYGTKNVLEAAFERYEIVFQNFDHVYLSVSGGKDSSIMLQLAAMVARKMNRKLDVLYIDLEAQYAATIAHIEELREDTKDVVENFFWVALPISLRNAVSVIQPKWLCWGKEDKKKWVRPMPKHDCVINEDNYLDHGWDWFRPGTEFEMFIIDFANWYGNTHPGLNAAGIGIRSDESFNRFRTIITEKKTRFKNYGWTTQVQVGGKPINVFNFYPLYDWRTEDDWGAVAKLNLKYNHIYELMYKNGLSIHEQRLCQPYGDDQRGSLDQFRYLEPETWEKVLNRVHGVNFGNIYARSSLLGNIKSEKPEGMSWQQYAIWLLETIGLYAPELRDHYYRKIKRFFYWWDRKYGIPISQVQDSADTKIESAHRAPTWRRIARALEKNDFWMSRLSFSETKGDVERLFELKKKYRNIIYAKDTDQKHLRQVAELLEREGEG